jgi:diguanylate cyclase (GGDEF)-like protein
VIEDVPVTRPVTAPSPAEEREALDRSVAEMLPPLAAGLMAVWLVFSAGHALILSAQPRAIMLSLGLGTAALLGALWQALRRFGPLAPQLAHPLAATMAVLLSTNSIAHLALTQEPQQSTNIALTIVATGCVLTSQRWLLAVIAWLVGAWAVTASRIGPSAEWTHFGFMIFTATALAILVMRGRARLIASNHRAVRAQAAQAEMLRQLSLTDALTGLPNRRAFESTLRQEWERATRTARDLGVLVIDVDHFKRYNDSFGHLAGDQCLVRVAVALRAALRGIDTLNRYGGEEFVALLPETGPEQAFEVAERTRKALEAVRIAHTASGADAPQIVTVSIGVASARPRSNEEPGRLLEAADAALYRAKAEGRNRSVRAEATP